MTIRIDIEPLYARINNHSFFLFNILFFHGNINSFGLRLLGFHKESHPVRSLLSFSTGNDMIDYCDDKPVINIGIFYVNFSFKRRNK